MSHRQMSSLGALTFAVPFVIVASVGFITGLVICLMMLGRAVPLLWLTIGAILACTAVVGLTGNCIVAVVGSKEALREAE